MKKEIIYELPSLYRDNMRITGYRFGKGKDTLCIVGSIRGNEIQQLYTCSRIVKRFRELEEKDAFLKNKSVLVIPCVNSSSMNIGKRFWPTDNTDINRMFPGYNLGETTQRIAAGLFEKIQGFEYGIQFSSFYIPGMFAPHVRIMETGYENQEDAKLFGLPYTLIRTPKPYDTTTLNYNWQIWETEAFSLYTPATDCVDKESAEQAVEAVLRFMNHKKICKYKTHQGYISDVVKEKSLKPVLTKRAGIFECLVKVNDKVEKGELLGNIIDTYEGSVIFEIRAPKDGVVFFINSRPMVHEDTPVFKLL